MKISIKKLFSLPVYTESGIYLGRVKDITADAESGHLLAYEVNNFWLLFGSKNNYLISHKEVKSITSDKIIVEDAVIKQKSAAIISDKPLTIKEEEEAGAYNADIR